MKVLKTVRGKKENTRAAHIHAAGKIRANSRRKIEAVFAMVFIGAFAATLAQNSQTRVLGEKEIVIETQIKDSYALFDNYRMQGY